MSHVAVAVIIISHCVQYSNFNTPLATRRTTTVIYLK